MSERFCESCGYDLTGLSAFGSCPECGSFYDVTTGKGITGSSSLSQRAERGQRLMARIRTVILGLITLSILGCGGVLSWINRAEPHGDRPLVIACVIAIVAAMATVTSYVCEKD